MTDTPAATPGGTPPADPARRRAEEFVSSLPTTSDRSRRDEIYRRAGLALMVAGLVLAVVALVLSQATNNPLNQSTQISMGIAGLAAVGFGGVLFLRYSLGQLLRFWLLRMLHEQHRD